MPVNFFNLRRSSEKSSEMPVTSKRLAGPGFIILNVLRAMNITGLLAVVAASFIMVIKTFTASKVRIELTRHGMDNAEICG
jgi:hypothetical protein